MTKTSTEVIQQRIIINEPPATATEEWIALKEEKKEHVTVAPTTCIKPSLYTYQRRVSFDNVTNIPPAYHSFTLKQCSHGFERTRRSRTFMIAMDLFEGTLDSLSFTLKNLIDEGDEIIVVGVYSPNLDDNNINSTAAEDTLSPREKAQQIMNWIVHSHQGDNINMVVELTFGRPELALEEMMRMYQPSVLIVGSKIKTKYKHAYSGAGIFKYRLKNSHIPVVIVRDKGPGNSRSASTGDLIAASSSASASSSSNDILDNNDISTSSKGIQERSKANTMATRKKMKKSFSLFNCTSTYYYTSE